MKTTRCLRRWDRAFTLVETQIASVISVMLLIGLGSISIYCGRNFASVSNYAEMDRQSRFTLDTITKEIRQAKGLTAFSPTSITLIGTNDQPVQYLYSSDASQFKRVENGAEKVLLDGCSYFQFAMFKRNTTNGTFNQYPAANIDTCKLLQMSWACSRGVIANRANTVSVQSAKVVVRVKNATDE